MKDNVYVVLIIIAILLAAFFVGRLSKPCAENIQTVVKRDTTIVVKQAEPVIIEKAKAKIVYQRDTIIETKPFVAAIDTVIQKDTVYLRYSFPENNFDLWIRRQPDSTMIETITINKEIIKERPWWEVPTYILTGATVGFLLGNGK